MEYTQKNQSANRLVLVRIHRDQAGYLLTINLTARGSLSRPLIPSRTRDLTWFHHSGRLNELISGPILSIDFRRVQNNVLVTRDGRACLGDFGIVGAFSSPVFAKFGIETVRYMAPERFARGTIYYATLGRCRCYTTPPSKESDVYALSMTCFTVCPFCLKRTGIIIITPSSPGPHRGVTVRWRPPLLRYHFQHCIW